MATQAKSGRAKYVIVGVVLAAIIIGAASWALFFSAPPLAGKTIKIGAMEELTGPFAAWAVPHLKGMEFARDKINREGGVLGAKLDLVVADSKADPKEAVTIYRRMVELDGVVAVVGPVSSDVAIATGKEAERLKVPLILHMAGSDVILTKESKYTFRTTLMAAPMNIAAEAELIKARGYKRVGAIIADYAWGRAIERALKQYVAPIPGVQLQIEVAPVRETDFTTYLRKLKPLNPEIMILSGHPPGTTPAIKQMLELGIEPQATIAQGQPFPIYYKALGKDTFRGGITEWGFYDPQHPEFIKVAEEFRKATGTPIDRTSASGYQSVFLIAEAIKKAGSNEPAKIRDALSTIRYQTFNAYPYSYTPWGELKEARMVFIQFKPGPPPGGVDPTAEWHPEVLYISPPLEPYVPP